MNVGFRRTCKWLAHGHGLGRFMLHVILMRLDQVFLSMSRPFQRSRSRIRAGVSRRLTGMYWSSTQALWLCQSAGCIEYRRHPLPRAVTANRERAAAAAGGGRQQPSALAGERLCSNSVTCAAAFTIFRARHCLSCEPRTLQHCVFVDEVVCAFLVIYCSADHCRRRRECVAAVERKASGIAMGWRRSSF